MPSPPATPALDALLRDIAGWRERLARDVVQRAPGITQRHLNEVVQGTIDQILFLRICEERGAAAPGSLQRAAAERGIYRTLFSSAGAPGVQIGDELLGDILRAVCAPDDPYQLAGMSPELLGQVHEQLLGRHITIDDGRAGVEHQPAARKRGGVYYTPTYLVDDIVARTLTPLLAGRSAGELAGLRILDPACGAGAFLLGAYRLLLRWYLNHYCAAGAEEHARGAAPRLQRAVGAQGLRLSAAEKGRILQRHLFGVDIDAQAVAVTRRSLLLMLLAEEPRAGDDAGADGPGALPDLDANIRCGNALIEPDFLDRPEAAALTDEDRQRINPFDWRAAFPAAFAEGAGGFAVVLGNPPYAYRNATERALRGYYKERYACAEGNLELYKFFVERALSLLVTGGSLGLLLSSSFLVQPSCARLRALLLQTTRIDQLCPLGPGVFRGATIDTCVVIARRLPPDPTHMIALVAPAAPEQVSATPPYAVQQARFAKNAGLLIDYRLSEAGAALASRLFAEGAPLSERFELGVGINTGFIRAQLVSSAQRDERDHPLVTGRGISRYGEVKTEGWIRYDAEFVRQQGARGRTLPEERLLRAAKILIVRTRSLKLPRRVIATVDRSGAYNLNRLSNIIARPGADLAALLAILNSELFQWLFSTRFLDYEIKPVYLRSCPLPGRMPEQLGALAEQQRELHAAGSLDNDRERARSRERQAALDHRIDEAVYDAYKVSQPERRLIRAQLMGLRPALGAAPAPGGAAVPARR